MLFLQAADAQAKMGGGGQVRYYLPFFPSTHHWLPVGPHSYVSIFPSLKVLQEDLMYQSHAPGQGEPFYKCLCRKMAQRIVV